MNLTRSTTIVFLIAGVFSLSYGRADESNNTKKAGTMDNVRLGKLLADRLDKLQGKPGFWKASVGKFDLFVITDEKHDRMRIMIPIQKIDTDDNKLLVKLLSANFDRALDAKYAINKGILWSAFLHRLQSLTEEDLDSALKQVRTLAENTGTSYSSSDLKFGADDDDGK